MSSSYINPKDQSKDQWLEDHGMLIQQPLSWSIEFPADSTLVCLIQNPLFSAAAICRTKRNFDRFRNPTDQRPKKWYLVPNRLIPEVERDL